MTKYLLTILLTSVSFASIASNNLIVDSSFTESSTRWKGNDNIVWETSGRTNKICKIEVNKHRKLEFYQDIKSSNIKDLIIHYRVKKSSDYKGRGYSVLFNFKNKGGAGRGQRIPSDTVWHAVEWKFSNIYTHREMAENQLSGVSDIRVSFIVDKGLSGSLSFDDIEVFAVK